MPRREGFANSFIISIWCKNRQNGLFGPTNCIFFLNLGILRLLNQDVHSPDTVIYPGTADLFSVQDVWKKATLEPHELITKFRETLPWNFNRAWRKHWRSWTQRVSYNWGWGHWIFMTQWIGCTKWGRSEIYLAHKPGPGISTLLEFQKLLPVPSAADKKRPNPDGAKYKSNYYRISKSSFLIHSSRQEFHINLQFCCHIVFILSLLLGGELSGPDTFTLSHFHTFTFSLSHFPQPPAWCESPELDTEQLGQLSHLLLAGQEVQDRVTKVIFFYFFQL